eukprot:717583-Pelagomonas_calceolata.AAC.3
MSQADTHPGTLPLEPAALTYIWEVGPCALSLTDPFATSSNNSKNTSEPAALPPKWEVGP